MTSYDVVTQTKSVIENVKTILEESGSSLEKVVDVQVFLTNMKSDFKKQVELLLDILDLVVPAEKFALKGGTAINLFVQDVDLIEK